MDNIRGLLKHNIFFTYMREDYVCFRHETRKMEVLIG